MRLPFLDRHEEAQRLRALVARREGSLGVLYGRRRCGKSRLLREILPAGQTAYYVGDDRESRLQRASMATEIARLLASFDRVEYPEWDALLARWWQEARPGSVLVIDELPALVARAPELPSLLQKHLDRSGDRGVHLLLAGSSQRMMQGLVLDRTAPLYGRATEILPIAPLAAGWIEDALGPETPEQAIESFAIWGGVPRYWELANDHPDLGTAIRSLVLSPLGALHEEPLRLLLDDLRDTTQAASILSLIGQGCHRVSEIAGRLGKPVTALSRPMQRLLEMGLARREQPYGESTRHGSKRSLYKISDPFLRFWFRHVEPNRSRLEAGMVEEVQTEISDRLAHHVGETWEELARASVVHLGFGGRAWSPAGRWWGPGLDRRPLELDVVSESLDGRAVLVGEVKWGNPQNLGRLLAELRTKAERLSLIRGREAVFRVWLKGAAREDAGETVVTPHQVLEVLR